MLYEGSRLSVRFDDGIAELCFDAQASSVNKFDQAAIEELRQAADMLAADERIQGVLVTSAKNDFIVGADIMEFGKRFREPAPQLQHWLVEINTVFSTIEDLDCPTVAAINGMALGGGCEMALATDFRVMSDRARLGVPETRLGIHPGFGGTVRLPRLIGADNAIEWIARGEPNTPADALAIGAVDAVVAHDKLLVAARDLLARAIAGEFDWRARSACKKAPLQLNRTEAAMAFESAKGLVLSKTGGMYPAPLAAIDTIAASAGLTRDGALENEAASFVKLAQSTTADALTGLFLNDQLIKKKGKAYGRIAHDINHAAVLGAGIMGGGIAFQGASKGVPMLMKDIDEAAIDQGLAEAARHFAKRVERGKIDERAMAQGMGRIRPTLNYGDFGTVDAVIEAVVEHPEVKKQVLAETEQQVGEDTILASNTSSISIDTLAEGLARPENFLGMHFFNPVHAMPLVEVIKGRQTSEQAVATVVSLAQKLGKKPIVINNCPGFLVNRILFPYFFGFQALLRDGADFETVDRVMTGFGWPMGPAHLLDVVGMDTAHHVGQVLAAGYPDRMAGDGNSALDAMVEVGRLGQKSGAGFYAYGKDRKGRPQKQPDNAAQALIAPLQADGPQQFEPDTIVERMMLPMIMEAARCLEEGIADTPNEIDMGLVLGTGFPPFRGGALKYADHQGLAAICARADAWQHLGPLYEPPQLVRDLAAGSKSFYPQP